MKYGCGKKLVCLLMAAILLLILCSAGHDCHGSSVDSDCPVCLVLGAWKWAAPALMAAMGLLCPVILALWVQTGTNARRETASLVEQKVKLSD